VGRWQRGSRGGGGGSTAAAASLAAEAAAWRKCNFCGSSKAFGSAVAAWSGRQQQRGIGSGNVVYADNNFNGHDGNND
jgi:hypothetical protein